MNKILMLVVLMMPMVVAGCVQQCDVEPIVEENHKLIVPPIFGQMPK